MGMDAQMAGDLVAMAEPVTKWSAMVMDPLNLLRMLRRAIKIAATPPMGPVYLCLPADVLDAPVVEAGAPDLDPFHPGRRRTGVQSERWPQLLAAAGKPMIFMGDGVAYSGAQAELAQVAELLGAEVWGADSGELNMSYAHPLYQGQTGHMFGFASKPIMERGDVNLIVGTYVLPEVFPRAGRHLRTGRQGHPHRPQRLRDRQEPPGGPGRGGRSQADAGRWRPRWKGS